MPRTPVQSAGPRTGSPRGASAGLVLAALATLASAGCATSSTDSAQRSGTQTNAQSGTQSRSQTADQPAAPKAPGELVQSGRTFTDGATTGVGSFVIDHDAWGRVGYRWDWAGYPPVRAGRTVRTLQAHDDVVITSDSGTAITVMDASTGKVDWNARTDRETARLLGIQREDDTLYVGTSGGFYEIDIDNGNIVNQVNLGTIVSTGPLVMDDMAIFGTPRGDIFGVSRSLKVPVLRYNIGGGITQRPTRVDDSTIVAVSERGNVMFLDIIDQTARSRQTMYGDTPGQAAVDEGFVWFTSLDQSVYAFVSGEERRLWRYRTGAPLRFEPVLIEDGIYVASTEGLIKLDANGRDDTGTPRAEGVERWTQPDLVNAQVVGVLKGDLVTFARSASILSRVDPENGDIVEQAYIPGAKVVTVDEFDDGNIYVLTESGAVLKFRPR